MFKSTSTFDKLLEKATSLTNLEPDWNAILQICDTIRQNDVQPKYALNAIKKKLYATNPNVELLALQVLESCVKNCGTAFHNEITTKAFMEELREIAKMSSDSKVRDEVLKLIQAWAHAFRNDTSHRAVQDTVNLMKIEGYKFPILKESDAMFAADSAPEWADGECCHRCRTQFSMVNRKHHCRNCGQIFCHKCSSKLSTIPKYGIEKEVRVCDDCFDKLNKANKQSEQNNSKSSTSGSASSDSSPYNAIKSKSNASNGGSKTEQEIQEEEELQLALALSQSEAESKEREQRTRSLSASSLPYIGSTKSNLKNSASPKRLDSSVKSLSSNNIDDPEISHYLNRDYWEQKALHYQMDDLNTNNPTPSAPQPQPILNNTIVSQKKTTNVNLNQEINQLKEKIQNGDRDEMESFLSSLRSAIEIFVNRINSNQLRGRPIANDSAVQSLFMNITNMHSQLLNYMQQQDESRSHFESLQDKLNQIRDARAALDALREEHRERLRREAEEAEMARQQQMQQKLGIMRQKKVEYLQYQREIALQRMQEQEREMLMRQEQQKYMPVWQQHSQPGIPVAMYSNAPQNASSTYMPYVAPTQPTSQQPLPQHQLPQQQIPQQQIPQQQIPQQQIPQQQIPQQQIPQQQIPQQQIPQQQIPQQQIPQQQIPQQQIPQQQLQQLPQAMPGAHPPFVSDPSATPANMPLYPPQTGYVATQPNANEFQTYNMQAVANSLQQMPINNQIQPMMAPNQHNPALADQHMQNNTISQNNNQTPVVTEAPLISFD